MPTFESTPGVPARGGVVVIQEGFGVTRHIEEVTERLAAEGWHAVAPSLFHRQGSPVLAYGDISTAMPYMNELTRDGILNDVDAALVHLEQSGYGPERQAIVGFCMGGSVAFFIAVDRPIGAAVTFYGGGIAAGRFGFAPQTQLAASLQTPWLGLYGDLDHSIPVSDVDELRDAASAASVPTEVVRYGHAGHGFNCDARASFNAPAAADAWSRMLRWFTSHIGT